MGRWVVAIVRDGSEMNLAALLPDELEVGSYCPAHRRWRKLPKHIARKTGRTRELVVDALIPGYLFINVASHRQLASVSAHKDVFGFVSTEAGPCFARDSDIEHMRAIERSGVHDVKARAKDVRRKTTTEELRAKLQNISLRDAAGKCATISGGPFAGMMGTVMRTSEDGQSATLLVAGKQVTATADMLLVA